MPIHLETSVESDCACEDPHSAAPPSTRAQAGSGAGTPRRLEKCLSRRFVGHRLELPPRAAAQPFYTWNFLLVLAMSTSSGAGAKRSPCCREKDSHQHARRSAHHKRTTQSGKRRGAARGTSHAPLLKVWRLIAGPTSKAHRSACPEYSTTRRLNSATSLFGRIESTARGGTGAPREARGEGADAACCCGQAQPQGKGEWSHWTWSRRRLS